MKKEPKEVNVTKEEAKEEAQPQRREKRAGTVANLVQRMSTYGIPAGGFQPHSQPRGLKKSKSVVCVNSSLCFYCLGTHVDVSTQSLPKKTWRNA